MPNLRFRYATAAITVAVATGLGAGVAMAQSSTSLLERYPVTGSIKGRPAPVDLKSHKQARMFRTRLRAAAAEGPRFAGTQAVASWGCGTSCQQIALIDSRTGRVVFGPTAALGYRYSLGSRLLIVNPSETINEVYGSQQRPTWLKTEYYLWQKGRLVKTTP